MASRETGARERATVTNRRESGGKYADDGGEKRGSQPSIAPVCQIDLPIARVLLVQLTLALRSMPIGIPGRENVLEVVRLLERLLEGQAVTEAAG